MEAFPLQSNLRKLRPSVGKGISSLAILLIFGFDQIRNHWDKIFRDPNILIVAGIGLAVLLFLMLDLYLRQIFYNEQGIGIRMRFGGSETWYSFLELKQVRQQKRMFGRGMARSSRLVLEFYTGTVKIRTRLYDSKGVDELSRIISGIAMRSQVLQSELHPSSQRQKPMESWSPPEPTPASPKSRQQQPAAPSYPTPGKEKTPSVRQTIKQMKREQAKGSKP